MQGKAYWFKNNKLFELNGKSHIQYIIENPDIFGVSIDYIQKLYDKYGERINEEGKAREEIIKQISKDGWIRIRHYIRPKDYWSIQFDSFFKRQRLLKSLINYMIHSKLMSMNDEVVFLGYEDSEVFSYSYINGGIGKFLQEDKYDSDRIIKIKNIKEFKEMMFLEQDNDAKNYIEDKLFEKSLSRIWNHMQNHDTGFITAYRSKIDDTIVSHRENAQRNKSLLAKLQYKGYGVISVEGSYIENYGSSDEIEVGEHTFFVIDLKDKGNLKEDLIELGEVFDQDSILFIPKGSEKGMLIGTSKRQNSYPGYGVTKLLNSPVFGKEGEFLTRVRNRPFIFESKIEIIPEPNGMMGRMACKIISKEDWKDIQF